MIIRHINKIFDNIAGYRQQQEPEVRLFNIATILAVFVAFLSLSINIKLGFPKSFNITIGLSGLVMLYLYIQSRFRQKTMIWLYIFTTLSILSIAWFYCDGPYGSINYLFLLSLLVFLSICRSEHIVVAGILLVINLLILNVLYLIKPTLVLSYPTEEIKHADMLFTFTYTLAFTFLLIKALRQNHEEEKYQVEVQKTEIEIQHKYMKDSIYYARDIQKGFLQDQANIGRIFKNSFVFWQPKDIVSGDFYLFKKLDSDTDKVMVIVSDCTGHGVPGALITMLGISLVNEAIYQNHDTEPHVLLNYMRERVKHSLSQGRRSADNRDGMDMAVCIIDRSQRKISFAGSNRSLFLLRKNEIIELKGDRMPIGTHDNDTKSFAKISMDLEQNDKIYMFTDGYADQYGESNKKMYIAKFKTQLIEINQLPMVEQRRHIIEYFFAWKGKEEQTDDVLIVGFEPLA